MVSVCVIGVSIPTVVGVVVAVDREDVVVLFVVVFVIFISIIVDFKRVGNSCVAIVPRWALCVAPLFVSLFPLSVILFHILHDLYRKHPQAQACLFYVYGSLFFGQICAFLLDFSCAL